MPTITEYDLLKYIEQDDNLDEQKKSYLLKNLKKIADGYQMFFNESFKISVNIL